MRPIALIFGVIAVLTIVTQVSKDPSPWVSGAFWDMITALVSVGLALVALLQLSAMRESAAEQIENNRKENKIERTLQICLLYDTDPVLSEVSETLETANNTGRLKRNPGKYQSYIISLLNYFESIAIGVDFDLYDARIVEEHMKAIILRSCEAFAKRKYFRDDPELLTESYGKLRRLIERWGGTFPFATGQP